MDSQVRRALGAARPGMDASANAAFASASKQLFGHDAPPIRVGRYELLERIGKGGMGEVFRAHDPTLARTVAIKLVAVQSQHGAARLLREARAMAVLSHPNIVPVYDAGMHDTRAFLAMQLVEGETLRRWLDDGPHDLCDILARFVAVGRGLAAAHEAGLVHRDFKPDNVMCGRALTDVRVTDFGLSRPVGAIERESSTDHTHADLDTRLTPPDVVLGTPVYMSPEQHDGMEIGPASDQFSFCVSLFEAVCERLPFEARSVRRLAAAKRGGAVRWPEGSHPPKWLRAVLQRGLSPRPADRWPSMGALVAALQPARARTKGLALIGIGAAAAIAVAAAGTVAMPRGSGAPSREVAVALDDEPGLAQIEGDLRHVDALLREGRFATAAAIATRLLPRAEAMQSERGSVAVLNAIAKAENGAGRLDAAERAALDAYHRAEAAGLADAQVVASTTLATVVAYRAPNEAGEWIRHGLAAMASSGLARGPGHVELMLASARVHTTKGDWTAATAEYGQALVLLETMPDADPIVVARALAGIAGTHYFRREIAEAEAANLRALRILAADVGPGHPYVAEILGSMARVKLSSSDRVVEALTELHYALALQEMRLGPDHLKVARTLDWLTQAYSLLGAYEIALPLVRRASEIARRTTPHSRERTAYLNNVAVLCLDMGRNEEALAALREAVAVHETSQPGTDRFVAAAEVNMGVALQRLGRPDDAIEVFRRITDADPSNGGAWAALGEIHRELGDEAAARAAFERAAEHLVDDPSRADALAWIRRWLAEHEAVTDRRTAR